MSNARPQFTPLQRCDHCGKSVPMEIVASHTGARRYDDSMDSNLSQVRATIYELLSCPACQAVTLRSYDWDERILPSEIKFKTLYPGTSEGRVGLPDSAKRTYSTVRRFRTIDANAYRIMLRRLAIIHECNKTKSV